MKLKKIKYLMILFFIYKDQTLKFFSGSNLNIILIKN